MTDSRTGPPDVGIEATKNALMMAAAWDAPPQIAKELARDALAVIEALEGRIWTLRSAVGEAEAGFANTASTEIATLRARVALLEDAARKVIVSARSSAVQYDTRRFAPGEAREMIAWADALDAALSGKETTE